MARPQVLEELKQLGWDGPTSYTLPYLLEMIETLKSGTTVEQLKETRKKTSSAEVKGQGRQPKGEWVVDTPLTHPVDAEDQEWSIDDVKWRSRTEEGTQLFERFVPAVKSAKQRPEKGTWEVLDADISEELAALSNDEAQGEWTVDGVRYRKFTSVDVGEDMQPSGLTTRWERFVPTPPKAKGKLKGDQQANFDPREMLRVFENEDMRVRTGGRDWTLVDTDFLQTQLDGAKERGDAAVLVDVDGSQEACDVVWLEALVSVKRRLALREVDDEAVPAGGA